MLFNDGRLVAKSCDADFIADLNRKKDHSLAVVLRFVLFCFVFFFGFFVFVFVFLFVCLFGFFFGYRDGLMPELTESTRTFCRVLNFLDPNIYTTNMVIMLTYISGKAENAYHTGNLFHITFL